MKGAIGFTLFLIVQASLVKTQKTHQCNGHEIKVSEEKIAMMKKCGEEIGVRSMEEMTPEKISCFAKCIMQGSELVDADGKPHKENIMKSIDAGVPKEMQETYKQAMEKCLDDHGGKINPKEASCSTYGPLAGCATTAFKAICKS